MGNILHKNQWGDTIIEVLIAMTVASSVLGVSLSTMNRNLSITRDNQERTEASKLAQGQIEAFRSAVETGSITIPIVGSSFCLTNNGAVTNITGSNPHTSADNDTFVDYGNCKSTDSLYYYAITHDAANSYHFYVRWDALRGQPRHQVIMAYRI